MFMDLMKVTHMSHTWPVGLMKELKTEAFTNLADQASQLPLSLGNSVLDLF